MEFREYIRTLRFEAGLSPNEVAEKVGFSPAFIRGIERGAQNVSAEAALRILRVFRPGARFVDEYTVECGGHKFEFAIARRGQNARPKDKEDPLLGRIKSLEARVAELERELRQRELHHFETEQENAQLKNMIGEQQ